MSSLLLFILSLLLFGNVFGDGDGDGGGDVSYEKRGVCKYCKYCAFCEECRHCPCQSQGPDDLPYCELTIFINTLRTMCDYA